MGLDQYLYAEKYLSTFKPESVAMMNSIGKSLGLNPVDPDAIIALDSYPRVAYIKILVLQWRKDYVIDDFFQEKIDGKDNGSINWVSRELLGDLVKHLKLKRKKASSEARCWLKQDIEDLEKILANPFYDDLDFYYSSNW